jgi:hypothetical protein
MPGHRRYSRTEKAQVVGQALATNAEAASESTGIPKSTIRYWMKHPDFAELRSKTREDVADMLWAAIQIGADQVAQGLMNPDAPLRDKATAFGILYDKHALLTGSATSRTESRELSDRPDHEKRLLADAIARELAARRAVGRPAGGHPEGTGAGD